MLYRLLGPLAVGDVEQHVDGTDKRARIVVQRCRIGEQVDPRPVRPLRDDLNTPDRPIFPQRHGHRALVMRQRCAVGQKQPPAHAPLIGAELRLATRPAASVV